MRDESLSFTVGQKCLAVAGVVGTVVSFVLFVITGQRAVIIGAFGGVAVFILALWLVLRDEHSGRLAAERAAGAAPDPREAFRALLESATTRFDYVTSVDSTQNPMWSMKEYQRRHNDLYEMIDQYLGGEVANEFVDAGTWGLSGHPGFREALPKQSAYPHELLARLDSLPIMADWKRQKPRDD